MAATCVNLRERFGEKYRIEYEESYWAEREIAGKDDPWLQIIPCDFGHIYPHGGTTLAASINKRGPTMRTLVAMPCCRLWQDADDGATVLFDVADFKAVAKIMRPKRRRQVSDEERARLAEMSRRFGFNGINRMQRGDLKTLPTA